MATSLVPRNMDEWMRKVETRLTRQEGRGTSPFRSGLVDIATGTDLNNLTQPGDYIQRLTANAQTSLNYPVSLAGMLEVYNTDDSYMTWQRYTTYKATGTNNSRTFIRNYYSGSWSAWREYAFTDLDTVTVASRLGTGNFRFDRSAGVVSISATITYDTTGIGTDDQLNFLNAGDIPAGYRPTANRYELTPIWPVGADAYNRAITGCYSTGGLAVVDREYTGNSNFQFSLTYVAAH